MRRSLAVLVGLLLLVSLWRPVVVVGEIVVRPEVMIALLSALVVVGLISLRVAGPRAERSFWRGCCTTVAIYLVGLVVIWRALLGLGTSYVLLEPAGPSGCRVIVEETSFLLLGSGRVGAVGRVGVSRFGSDYTADDGGRPASEGGYSVRWRGDDGVIRLTGGPGQPVWPALHEVSC